MVEVFLGGRSAKVVLCCALVLLPAALAFAQEADVAGLPQTPQEALKLASTVVTYKRVGSLELQMHLFIPKNLNPQDMRPALLGIHGGSWKSGDAWEYAEECLYFSRKGMVTATMTYRLLPVAGKSGSTNIAKSPADCLADAKSAIRYLRQHARELHIDPNKIAVAGASAGGHLASALAAIKGFDDPHDDPGISAVPNALVLFYPVYDLVSGWRDGAKACVAAGISPEAFSPALQADETMPPTLVLAGKDDPYSTLVGNVKFAKRMMGLKREVHLVTFAGRGHKLFEFSTTDPYFQAAMHFTSLFLQEIGYIARQPKAPDPQVPFEVLD